MSYKRAEQILPAEMIELIQHYADGVCLYIPKKKNTRRGWGERTGIREELKERNEQICLEYHKGAGVRDLAERYFLSEKSIQRILRKERR